MGHSLQPSLIFLCVSQKRRQKCYGIEETYHSLESIPGLLKRLQIWALATERTSAQA